MQLNKFLDNKYIVRVTYRDIAHYLTHDKTLSTNIYDSKLLDVTKAREIASKLDRHDGLKAEAIIHN